MNYKSIFYGDIEVFYNQELDGGGTEEGQDYLQAVPELIGHAPSVFEWCAGPGFIGFALLAFGHCDRLTLADVHAPAISACWATIEHNSLQDKVSAYVSDGLKSIPAAEQWDLVVGNPPHSGTTLEIPKWGDPRIYMDPGWALHHDFYQSVGPHLSDCGQVLIQENYKLSSVETFEPMLTGNGFELLGSPMCALDNRKYYVWSRPKCQ